MRFKATVTNALTIKLPAEIVEFMKIKAGDLVEINVEHGLYSLIASSAKFTEYCRKMGSTQMQAYTTEFQNSGGYKRHGSFRLWLVRRLELASLGLAYWTGYKSLQEIFPDNKLPVIEPVGKDVAPKKEC